jgi:xylan 1,4-beta-xylosidase
MVSRQGALDEPPGASVSIEGWERCYLKVSIDYDRVQFYCSQDGSLWLEVGQPLDLGQLSDEYEGKLGFTGAFIGLCVQDLAGTRKHADFDFFRYQALGSE